MQLAKSMRNRLAELFVQRKALGGPVAGRAQPANLVADAAAVLLLVGTSGVNSVLAARLPHVRATRLPLPHTLQESVTPKRRARGALLHEQALNNELRGNAGMVGA